MPAKSRSKISISVIVVSVATIALVGVFLDWQRFFALLRQVQMEYLIILIVSLQVQQLAGGNRFRLGLLRPSMPTTSAWATENVAALSAFFLPFGAGEAGRLFVWRRQTQAGLAELGAAYLYIRFIDVFVVMVLIAGVSWACSTNTKILPPSLRYVAAAAVLIQIVLYAIFVLYWRIISTWSEGRLAQSWLARQRAIAWALAKINSLIQAMERLSRLPLSVLFRILCWSAVYWGLQFLDIFWLLWGIGVRLSLSQVLVLYVIWWAMTLLPIQGVARLGSHEASWAAALIVMGFSSPEALAITASSHVLLIARMLLAQIFTAGLIFYLMRRGQWV